LFFSNSTYMRATNFTNLEHWGEEGEGAGRGGGPAADVLEFLIQVLIKSLIDT
jgi:hypothetical protein